MSKKTTNSTYTNSGATAGHYDATYKPTTYKSEYEATTYTADPFETSDATNSYYDKVTNAENTLNNFGNYNSNYSDQISSVLDKLINGEKFSYDFNADPLYQQYKDSYTKLGAVAAQNAAANVSALSGGYGNSYAATAATQANQQYLTELNEVIPELAEQALEKYQMEREDLYNQYGVLSNQDETEYGRWSDDYNRAFNLADYYQNAYSNSYSNDLNRYSAENTANYQANSLTEDSKQYADSANMQAQYYTDQSNQAYEDALYKAWSGNESVANSVGQYNLNAYQIAQQLAFEQAELALKQQEAAARNSSGGSSKKYSGSSTEDETTDTGAGSNKTVTIQGTDANGNTVNYTYDANGNLLNDPNRNLHN